MNSNATSRFQRNEDKTLVGQINKNISSYKQKMSELKEYQRGNENLRGLWSSAIRKIEGKKQPVVVDFHLKGKTAARQANARMGYYMKQGYEVNIL